MKSFMKFFIPVLVLVLTIGITAQPGSRREMRNSGHGIMKEKLNLTADQEKKIDDLRTAHQKKMIDLHADIQKLQLDKKELLNKGNYDRKTFLALEDKIIQQRNVIEKSMANHRMDVYEILDAKQKELWDKRPAFGERGKMGKMGRGMKRNMDCPNNCWSSPNQ